MGHSQIDLESEMIMYDFEIAEIKAAKKVFDDVSKSTEATFSCAKKCLESCNWVNTAAILNCNFCLSS